MTEHDDDRPMGRVLTRRDIMRLVGAGGLATLLPSQGRARSAHDPSVLQAGLPSCIVRLEQTEGPYFVDRQLARADVRAEPSTGKLKPGEVLALSVLVSRVDGGSCRPLPGAIVDIWSCDAQGVYSGVRDPGFDTSGLSFLRGTQTSDADGRVRFTTIYPGWYPGRTVHIHFKIRTQVDGRAHAFTSQWYFDEAMNDRVLAGPAYARPGRRDTSNAGDGIYRTGGRQLTLDVQRGTDGLMAAAFSIGLDLSNAAAGGPDGLGRSAPGRRPAGPGRGPE